MQSTVRFGLKMFLLSVVASVLGFAQTPSISSVSPNPLGIGQSVTISGTNFGTSGTVTFSGVTASTTSWSSTSIVATAPTGITNGNIVVTAGGHASNGFAFTLNNGPVNYVYDNLGRLIEVVDVNGNAAEYTYDAVGNILSISRFTASQVSISEFNPLSGPVGSSVTIYGSGFSTTLSQNTVKFNGTTATVSSSSTSQLQVTVPSSATTGPISVTSPNGTATSATNFSVTSSNGLPTITSFTPGSGVAATAVSLTGLNFDPTLANDKLRLNASQAVVTTATSTNLSTTVPSATASGHFTLLAPAGTSVSSQDFYVPFNSHVAADIGYTTRITLPGSATVTLTGSHIGLILFDGTEGQHLSIGIGTSTLASCTFYLIAPNDSNGYVQLLHERVWQRRFDLPSCQRNLHARGRPLSQHCWWKRDHQSRQRYRWNDLDWRSIGDGDNVLSGTRRSTELHRSGRTKNCGLRDQRFESRSDVEYRRPSIG